MPDPKWLVGVNASQLLVGLIGNLVLLLNFAQRVRYVIAQVTTISCWYFSSFSLLALVAATETTLRPADTPKRNYGFSQSFYYGIMSLVLYFIISTLLVWNLLGALLFHKYRASFATLTISQRTLMLQTVSYSLYLAMGAGVFGRCEGWGFVNALYWADYTLLTIGLGTDFPLKTTLGRALVIPYAICGILMVGLVVGSVRGLVLERRKAMKEVEKERDEVKQDHRRSGGGEKDGEHSRRGSKEMKKVREKAERRRKWWGFFYSLSAAVIVWAGGAAVFWRTERETQKWTYFEASVPHPCRFLDFLN